MQTWPRLAKVGIRGLGAVLALAIALIAVNRGFVHLYAGAVTGGVQLLTGAWSLARSRS